MLSWKLGFIYISRAKLDSVVEKSKKAMVRMENFYYATLLTILMGVAGEFSIRWTLKAWWHGPFIQEISDWVIKTKKIVSLEYVILGKVGVFKNAINFQESEKVLIDSVKKILLETFFLIFELIMRLCEHKTKEVFTTHEVKLCRAKNLPGIPFHIISRNLTSL